MKHLIRVHKIISRSRYCEEKKRLISGLPRRFITSLRYAIKLLAMTALGAQVAFANLNVNNDDKVIQQLYHQLDQTVPESQAMPERVDIISRFFLGKPYLYGALGEGKSGLFDQAPLYRTDAFDCLTYVSTVLALTESHNLKEFQTTMLKVQYRNSLPIFQNRLHFTNIDWNVVNTQNGFIQDITTQITPDTVINQTYINKPAWYRKMTEKNLNLVASNSLTQKEIQERVNQLHQLALKVQPEMSRVVYIPLTTLFQKNGSPNMALFNKIPSGSIIEIVRSGWDLTKIIGTSLDISHLGFAIRTSPSILIFREASSLQHRVIDVPLITYLQGYLHHSTVRGITVSVIILR